MKTHRNPVSLSRSGFSLVEVLASMAVLSVIVLIVARLFTNSSNAWDAGTRRMNCDILARSTLEFIARELSQAVADTNISFAVTTDSGASWLGTKTSDRLFFVAINSRGEYRASDQFYREAEQVTYNLTTKDLDSGTGFLRIMRGVTENEYKASYTSYSDLTANWWGTLGNFEMGIHVIDFKVNVYDTSGAYVPNYNSRTAARLPLFVDLYLAVMDSADAIRAVNMTTGKDEYVKLKARRYSTRVFLNNRYEAQP